MALLSVYRVASAMLVALLPCYLQGLFAASPDAHDASLAS